jgi:hypothetical protein
VVTYDNTTHTTILYIDGARKKSTTSYYYKIDATTAEMVIGAEIDKSGWNFKGDIDEVFGAAGALPEIDVKNLYNLKKPVYYNKDLYCYYPHICVEMATLRDFTLNGHFALPDNCGAGVDRLSCGGASFQFGTVSGVEECIYSYYPMPEFPSGNSAKTICGWFKSNKKNTLMMLFGFGTATEKYNFQVGIFNNSSSDFRVNGYGSSNDWNTAVSATSYLDNNWHHCAVTYDGTTTTLYLDGAKKSSTTGYTYNTDPARSIVVAGNEIDKSGWEWVGNLDDIRVYKRALSATDISTLYNLEKTTCLVSNPR